MSWGTLHLVSAATEPTEPEPELPDSGEVLLVVGEGHLIVHVIAGDEVVIGRAEGCDLRLDHRALSRRHAVLRRRPLSIQDLGSTNGLRIARSVVRGGEPIALDRGDSFHIGPFAFMVADARSAEPSTGRTGRERLVVNDPTPDGVGALVAEIARSGINVLVQGETGVGKEVLAHTIHELGERSGPFLSINCASLSDALLESELFGYERGAFTGAVGAKQGLLEAAAGGTLFLDEIGELPQAIQARLLRAVESREIRRLGSTKSIAIDVRIVAATNRDLADEVAAGRFRDDLLFRLDGVTLRIPPLRDRRNAIAPLALQFIDEAARRLGRPNVHPTPELFVALRAHDWPGNVRELRAVIDRALLLSRGSQIGSRHLAFTSSAKAKADAPAAAAAAPPPVALGDAEQSERERIVAALEACGGNQTRAAKALGMARSTLVAKLRLYRVPRPRI